MAIKIKHLILNPEGLTKTGAVVGFILWIFGLGWHGIIGQPSMMSALYGIPYMNMMMQSYMFIILVGGGALIGWLIAIIYNWSIKS